MMTAIRHPVVAGTFYPADPDDLGRQLALFLSEAANDAPAPALPKAIIGPHAGYAYSGPVAARAYARLAAGRGTISRVVLIGPSHHVAFRGLAVDTAEAWTMPGGTVALDTDTIARLRVLPMVGELDVAYQREHALEVHVPFLQHVLGDFRLVPIVAGDAPPEAVAAVFDAVWGGPETLIVVSTDLSHYLDYAACRRVDQSTAEAIERFEIGALGPTEACGAVPTRGLLLAAQRRGMSIERLDLRNSGDTAGPRDRVVGYGAWALYEGTAPVDPERAARWRRWGRSCWTWCGARSCSGWTPASRRACSPMQGWRRCWQHLGPRSSPCADRMARCAAASARPSRTGRWSSMWCSTPSMRRSATGAFRGWAGWNWPDCGCRSRC